MRLSKNFYLHEFLRSQTATRLSIDNEIPEIYIPNLKALVENVLQPVRDTFGPVTITSGYRSPILNSFIGGSANSEHKFGKAADFIINGADNLEVCKWIRDNCTFNQLILEFYDDQNRNKGWIHCSYSSVNAKEVLTAKKVNGRTSYFSGFPNDTPKVP